ncbi:MAG: DUF3147 family protein [bacterium]|nr:DUF3147 family protein [bacterium]MDT8364981.1 DUF3147 family protein [bacterium]
MSSAAFFFIKVAVSAFIIAGVSELAKRMPSLGGLIAAMPLTTLLVLIWLYAETGDYQLAYDFTRSVLFAIVPTIFFFITALYLFKKGVSFITILVVSFVIFLGAAAVHQWLLPDKLR